MGTTITGWFPLPPIHKSATELPHLFLTVEDLLIGIAPGVQRIRRGVLFDRYEHRSNEESDQAMSGWHMSLYLIGYK